MFPFALSIYILLQTILLLKGYQLSHWDEFQKRFPAIDKEPESKELFCRDWMVVATLTFGLDVWIICKFSPFPLATDIRVTALSISILLIPIGMTLYKAGLIRLLWLHWSVERLRKKLNAKKQ